MYTLLSTLNSSRSRERELVTAIQLTQPQGPERLTSGMGTCPGHSTSAWWYPRPLESETSDSLPSAAAIVPQSLEKDNP
jgi:hypothetical protein